MLSPQMANQSVHHEEGPASEQAGQKSEETADDGPFRFSGGNDKTNDYAKDCAHENAKPLETVVLGANVYSRYRVANDVVGLSFDR